jgi:hypothetical protein
MCDWALGEKIPLVLEENFVAPARTMFLQIAGHEGADSNMVRIRATMLMGDYALGEEIPLVREGGFLYQQEQCSCESLELLAPRPSELMPLRRPAYSVELMALCWVGSVFGVLAPRSSELLPLCRPAYPVELMALCWVGIVAGVTGSSVFGVNATPSSGLFSGVNGTLLGR